MKIDENDYKGYFEKEGKNPILASFILILLIGALYFFIQSLIVYTYRIIDYVIYRDKYINTFDFIEAVKQIYQRYKYPLLITLFICQFGILLFPTIYLFKRWHFKNTAKYFYLKNFDLPAVILSMIGALSVIPLVDLTSRISFYFFPILKKLSEAVTPLFSANNNPLEYALLIIVIGLTPAICEEVVFRGYFQRTLSRKIKEPWHYILSGFIFALYHQRPLGILALTLVGVYLGFIYYRFKSLYTSMSAHFIYNTTIVLIMNLSFLNTFLENNYTPILLLSSSLFIINGIIIFLYSLRKKFKKEDEYLITSETENIS